MTFDWIAQPSALVLALALAFDLLVGELPPVAHPVVWMGRVIAAGVQVAPRGRAGLALAFGCLLALTVPLAFAVMGQCLLAPLAQVPVAWVVVSSLLLTSTFALRGLRQAAYQVRTALAEGKLPAARMALRSLCSRDASDLSEGEVVGAAVESLAENTSDSVVAPLFYYALFGLPGAIIYRAVNTLDSMVGYHGHYEYLGKASARLDDLLNFIPARLTAVLMLIAGGLLRLPVARGVSVLFRDAGKTESPNAGWPMAAMAGLLGVQLDKRKSYTLGDAVEPLSGRHIRDAWRVVLLGAGLAALTVLAFAARSALTAWGG
jgi:adenosylcobinamide-phosphate synthase